MNRERSLYTTALLAWRGELEKLREEALRYKRVSLREGLRLKLIEMFGPDYEILEESDVDPNNHVRGAVINNLSFLAIRQHDGNINVHLLVPCSRCGYQMPSEPLSGMSSLGRELLQLEMNGHLGNHECPTGSENSSTK
ncbi:MAG: hypothetical protein WBP93_02025 [Pyrinomonadaceae bacterium]